MPDAQPPPTADAPAPGPPPDLTGRTLGDYQLLRRLGAGGMGQVYLARQLSLKRDVAVKLLRDDLATNPTALKRFQAEAEAVAKLNHPNIVHIHQIGEHDGLRYMVLEYVEGRNLRDYLTRKGPPDLAVTLSVIRQVALALQKAHEEGIVHRDIKPENILVTRKVGVKVTDFGLSRFFAGEAPAANLTQSGLTLGTPLYMSPEQVQGRPVDNRSDIYSLGVTCYHLLAGEPPFRGTTAFDVALKHVQEQPRPLAELRPDLPADLCGMVHKMMAKNPDDRYQSVREVLLDLAKVRDGIAVGLPAQPPALTLSASYPNGVPASGTPVPQPQSGPVATPPHRRPWLLAFVLCLLAAAGGALAAVLLAPPPEQQTTRPPPPDSPGLPDIRPPKKIVSTRERELVALLEHRDTKPEEVVKASIELGLLYVGDRRLDEAKARFEKLEQEKFPLDAIPATRHAHAAGRLGRAIVLAYRDTPEAAKQSVELVQGVVNNPFPKLPGKLEKPDKGFPAVDALRLRYPELGQALAEALNRDAATLGKTTLNPAALESLRSPPRGGR
jgi:serine/threonine-protein kinase